MNKDKQILAPFYNNITVKKKLWNYLMVYGRKTRSQNIFIKSIKLIQKTVKKDLQRIISLAIINSLPLFHAKKLIKKTGKQKFLQEIPFVLSKNQRIALSIKYILLILKTEKQTKISKLIKLQFLSYSKLSLQKKTDSLQKFLIEKKKFAKFRWFL
jgi:ribosomal protein S7